MAEEVQVPEYQPVLGDLRADTENAIAKYRETQEKVEDYFKRLQDHASNGGHGARFRVLYLNALMKAFLDKFDAEANPMKLDESDLAEYRAASMYSTRMFLRAAVSGGPENVEMLRSAVKTPEPEQEPVQQVNLKEEKPESLGASDAEESTADEEKRGRAKKLTRRTQKKRPKFVPVSEVIDLVSASDED